MSKKHSKHDVRGEGSAQATSVELENVDAREAGELSMSEPDLALDRQAREMPFIDRKFLRPTVSAVIPAFAKEALLLAGSASCEWFGETDGDGPADETITDVTVTVGSGPAQLATPTGPAETPWTSWQAAIDPSADGAWMIVIKVFASGSGYVGGSDTDSGSVTFDRVPPNLSVDKPTDIVAPPYVVHLVGRSDDAVTGVDAVEWKYGNGPSVLAATVDGWAHWSADIPLEARVGAHTIVVKARDKLSNAIEKAVTVQLGESVEPTLELLVPAENAPGFPLVDGIATVDVRGKAFDDSGIALVEWALDDGEYTPAIPHAPDDWSTWSALVQIDKAGDHTLSVRAIDKATLEPNDTLLTRALVVAEPFDPADPDAVFSPAAYLDDLLDFAVHRAKTGPEGAMITRELLVDSHLQPFADLVTSTHRAVANQSANQVRLCIDVLRRYMGKHASVLPEDEEAVYRQAVYVALLRGVGTSHEEIRLARVDEDAARQSLAGRLGIGLSGSRPDRLDQLLLQAEGLTEGALKTLFGLEETTVKPLDDSLLPEALLLSWQKEHLRVVWKQQDDAARASFDLPAPVIDPDLVILQDLRTASEGDAAFDLWTARREDLAAFSAGLDTARRAQPTQMAGFDHIVSGVLGPVADLLALDEARRRGEAVEESIREKLLTPTAFLHLMRVRELAVAGVVLDAEWIDVCDILTQVNKLGRYAQWRSEEQGEGLILGPDAFKLPDAAEAVQALLNPWRATPQARQSWLRTLDSRMQQEMTLKQAMQSVVEAAEELALPLLRQACVVAIAGDRDAAVIADRLTRELGIDCKDSGHQRTTRALQALATLQEVLLSLRTGRLKTEPPVLGTVNSAADWELALVTDHYIESDFDEEWLWMGGYATWNAAMRVFAYPESYLLPELRPVSLAPIDSRPHTAQTKAFSDLMAELRDRPRLTPAQARILASDYLVAVKAELNDGFPDKLNGIVITDQLTDVQLVARRVDVAKLTIDASSSCYQEIFYFVPMAMAMQLQKSGQYLVALDWIETVYTDHFKLDERKIYRGLELEQSILTRYQRNPENWLRVGLNPHEIAMVRANAYTHFTLTTLVRCYLDFADAEFTRDDGESVARARSLYTSALSLLALPEMQPPTQDDQLSPFPPNPVPHALRMRAELNLFKLRSGRNIAGIARQAPPIVQPSLNFDRLPSASEMQRHFRPTPYHYNVLIERAKNLVSVAQQVEQAYLAALEKRDAETYSLLKAGHDLALANAALDLKGLQVLEADQGIDVAQRQYDRAAIQSDTYQDWIDGGLSLWESRALDAHVVAGTTGMLLAAADANLAAAQAMTSALSAPYGPDKGPAMAAATHVATAVTATASLGAIKAAAEATAQVGAMTASFERRSQEWQLQRQLAGQDMAISSQQKVVAQTHAGMARQESFIAQTQRDQADATVQFLNNKFTNAELYAWMSGILGGAYNYFLQQATAMAQLAQYQLAFERQESPPPFIKADYWEATDDSASAPNSQDGQPDRRGMTGSVRLLQDITRLDQFAFDSNKRKLQLMETFSLAQLFPVEFQRFRETGRLPFATPMSLFDSGFPGHYLRLISRVSLSLVALVPPRRGVRATLIASGISRVVTGGDTFQTLTVRRDPELIAFTSTSSATGLLDLQAEQGMLRPFESMGVDTSWELQLPKAANPFDFGTIADALFTVEYTALQDFTYRQQVIQQMDDVQSADRVVSIRDQYADQWYALHNAEHAETPMTVKFKLDRQSFPPNFDDVRIQQVMFAVARADGQTFEIGNTQLMLTPQGESLAVGGAVDGTTDGLISTRRGNGSAWVPMIGKSPAGDWELTLPNTEEMRNHFKNEEVDDLLLVLTCEGRTPAWPM